MRKWFSGFHLFSPSDRSTPQPIKVRDLDAIFALENDTDFAAALSPVLFQWTAQGERLDRLSPEARAFYLCSELDMQVNNGGFSAFLYNPAGQWGPETVEALKAVGAPRTAELLRQVIALLPGDKYPRDLTQRNQLLLDVSDSAMDKLDTAFFAAPDGDLLSLYVSYARSHREAFSAPDQ